MNKSNKLVSICCSLLLLITYSNIEAQTTVDSGTRNFRDYYEDCTTKVSGSINGVSINIETSGSKNNCRESESNTCHASGCKSQTVEAIVNATIKK